MDVYTLQPADQASVREISSCFVGALQCESSSVCCFEKFAYKAELREVKAFMTYKLQPGLFYIQQTSI